MDIFSNSPTAPAAQSLASTPTVAGCARVSHQHWQLKSLLDAEHVLVNRLLVLGLLLLAQVVFFGRLWDKGDISSWHDLWLLVGIAASAKYLWQIYELVKRKMWCCGKTLA